MDGVLGVSPLVALAILLGEQMLLGGLKMEASLP